ncbi:MAG: shikimate kinase [Pseudomonadota bacterium]|nr:shikimate kinase [Pseudomonadota bacterium]
MTDPANPSNTANPARLSNIILIGMPGSGKSTVGVLLAKQLGLGFIDTDLLIQENAGRTLQHIVDHDGYQALRRIEEQVLLALRAEHKVISTGGSAVYSAAAMDHLKTGGIAVFLDIPLPLVIERIGDHSMRGISRRPDQSLEDLFEERHRLYQRYADLTVAGQGKTQDEVCREIVRLLFERAPHLVSGS